MVIWVIFCHLGGHRRGILTIFQAILDCFGLFLVHICTFASLRPFSLVLGTGHFGQFWLLRMQAPGGTSAGSQRRCGRPDPEGWPEACAPKGIAPTPPENPPELTWLLGPTILFADPLKPRRCPFHGSRCDVMLESHSSPPLCVKFRISMLHWDLWQKKPPK